MFCKNCGQQIPDNLSFCSFCGTPVKQAPQMQNDQTQVLSNMPPQAFQQETQIFTPMNQMPVQSAPPQPAPAPKKKKAPQKSNNNGVVIALIVLLIVIIISGVVIGVVFLTKDKDKNSDKKKDSETSSSTSVSTTIDTSTTTAPDNKPDQPAPTYLKATASDFDLLADIFAAVCVYADNYHPKNVTAQNDVGLMLLDLFAETYYICADEYGWDYPERFSPYDGEDPDPRGVFSTENYAGYYVYPEDKIQWIAQNMFNLTLTESEGYIEEYDGSESLVWYYDSGKYYSYIIATGADGYYLCSISDCNDLRDDGKYTVVIDLYYIEMEMPESYVCSYEVVAGLKEVDGTRIWSFDEWKVTA